MKRAGKSDGGALSGREDAVLLNDVMSQNLSNKGFYIQKADVEFDSDDGGMNFVATIKFMVPDKYLISVRMLVGIEVARIYISSDTVLVNDRINRTLYYGDPAVLLSKYGVPFEIFPVVFGDLITVPAPNDRLRCVEGKVLVNAYVKGMKLVYEVDCGNRKPLAVRQEGSYKGEFADITYSGFKKNNDIVIPGEIAVNHRGSGSRLKIRIDKVETPWEGNVEFIPGNRYQRVELK